jgi:hypothetical protein
MKNIIFIATMMAFAISCANSRSELFKFYTPYGVSREEAISDYLSCRRDSGNLEKYKKCMLDHGYKPINNL